MRNLAAEVGTRKRIIRKAKKALFNSLVFDSERCYSYWTRCCEKWVNRGFDSAWKSYTRKAKNETQDAYNED